VQAMGGRYSMAEIVENQGVQIGAKATAEDIAENWAKISDLSAAKPRG